MIKLFYSFLLLFFLFSCSNNITKNDIEEINLDNKEIDIESTGSESLIDQTTDKDVDELIDILFDTNY